MSEGAFAAAADLLDPPDWTRNPDGWVEQKLHEHVWSIPRQIMHAVRDHRRVVVESCHGLSKSWTASRIAGWWIDSNPLGDAFVVTSAPTFAQVRVVLWREMNKMHKRGHLRGRMNQLDWSVDGELVALGRKPSDYDQSAFQGIHALKVLVILDEGDGIPEQLYIDANSLMSNDDCRMLVIGNPDQPESHMSHIATPGSGWHVIQAGAFDTPNFTGEDIPDKLRALLVNQTYVDEIIADYGEDSPIYQSKVLGKRPRDSTDTIVRYSDATACRTVELEEGLPVELGVDVGRGGDESVIRERRGMRAGREWTSRHDDTMGVVGEVVRALERTEATSVKVDVVGIGAGVYDRLRELKRDGTITATIVPVNVGEKSTATVGKRRFVNLKAQMWWEIGRMLSEQRAWDLSTMGNADRTVGQLVMPKWGTDSAGRIWVEGKDDLRKRLGRSPDNADALLLAFHTPGNVSHAQLSRMGQQRWR